MHAPVNRINIRVGHLTAMNEIQVNSEIRQDHSLKSSLLNATMDKVTEKLAKTAGYNTNLLNWNLLINIYKIKSLV